MLWSPRREGRSALLAELSQPQVLVVLMYLIAAITCLCEWWVNLLAVVLAGYASRCVGQPAWRLWQPARTAVICAVAAAVAAVVAARCWAERMLDRRTAGCWPET